MKRMFRIARKQAVTRLLFAMLHLLDLSLAVMELRGIDLHPWNIL